jgi:hypothetical protein
MEKSSINAAAASATLHCLTGCAVGEVTGMVITTAANASNETNIILSIVLAFVFGYAFSLKSLLAHNLGWRKSLRLALAADTASIAVMEAADSLFIILVPGAINAALDSRLFWVSLLLSLGVAFIAAFPVNRCLITRGKGHAVLHDHH